MRGLSFTIHDELYAVDVTLVQKVARKLMITPVPSAPAEVVGIANLKGRVVTVINLNKLLNLDNFQEAGNYINTIVFKACSSTEDQMGLSIEKPGNLITIDSDEMRSPPLTAESEEIPYISGVTEINDKFYRIIDIESIRRRYIPGSDIITGNSSFGGDENE